MENGKKAAGLHDIGFTSEIERKPADEDRKHQKSQPSEPFRFRRGDLVRLRNLPAARMVVLFGDDPTSFEEPVVEVFWLDHNDNPNRETFHPVLLELAPGGVSLAPGDKVRQISAGGVLEGPELEVLGIGRSGAPVTNGEPCAKVQWLVEGKVSRTDLLVSHLRKV